ncbi:furry homolog-like protein [Tanacetum coccineum]
MSQQCKTLVDHYGKTIIEMLLTEVKTDGGLNASASFVAKANPLNRTIHKRKSELHHVLCNMLSNILAPLADGRKGNWPPPGVDPSLNLWSEAVARIRVQLMHWRDKQSNFKCGMNRAIKLSHGKMIVFHILKYRLG